MDRADEKKLTLVEYSWHLINNLQEFNTKFELVESAYLKMRQYLPEHPILSQFYEYYKTAIEYYQKHTVFPDIKWFEVNFAKSGKFKRTTGDFSIQVYEDYVKLIDSEIIKKDCAAIVNTIQPDMTQLRSLINTVSQYCDNAAKIPALTKTDIINLYEDYIKDYSGVYTGIDQLDEQIGVLGNKSLSVFGAPSGHGKSTFAINVAFNAAINQGLCVDYVSYEVPKEHIWFNLISLFSADRKLTLPSSEIKEGKLTPEQRKVFHEVSQELLEALKKSGGFINVIDQTSAAVDTFEGLCARLEGIATTRPDGDSSFSRKADLIIIDNVDNLQVLKSSERDEQTRVNNYIIKLDAFCKQYYHNEGTAILILTQLNRGGLDRLNRTVGEDGISVEKSNKVDVTVFQKYNALYEKPTCCLVGYSNVQMRAGGRMAVFPVKLRNRGVPEEPIMLSADYAHSLIGAQNILANADPFASQTRPSAPPESLTQIGGWDKYAEESGLSSDDMDMFGHDDDEVFDTSDIE